MQRIHLRALLSTLPVLLVPGIAHAGAADVLASILSSVIGFAGDVLAGIATLFVAPIAMLIIWCTGWLLMLAANIFNILVQYTIVDFGSTLKNFGIDSGIGVVWSAFRDLSNIVIIGMFVFVAINIILGVQSFGQKKFVVRILIIAVLINFSLLFTKLAIDFSHIAARQFYEGMKTKTANTNVATISGLGTGNLTASGLAGGYGDIAGAFLNRAGLTSGFDSTGTLLRIAGGATKKGGVVPGGMQGLAVMFAYALTISLFMWGLIISFLFASYILASRALILIFLMLTSALAFAAYLIPKVGESSKFGFTAWWNALLKSVILAPLLMIFMWASLAILQPQGRGGGTGTLGAFFSQPGDPANWGALMAYMFAAGMLYLSIKFASNFSSQIPHFGIASTITKPLYTGARSLALGAMPFAARQILGRGAHALDKRFGPSLTYSETDEKLGSARRLAARLAGKTLRGTAGASFDPMRLPDAKKDLTKYLDKRFGFSSGGKGGFAAGIARSAAAQKEDEKTRMERKAKYYDATATEDERQKAFKEAHERVEEERRNASRLVADVTSRAAGHSDQEVKRLIEKLGEIEERHINAGGSFKKNGEAAGETQTAREHRETAERLRSIDSNIEQAYHNARSEAMRAARLNTQAIAEAKIRELERGKTLKKIEKIVGNDPIKRDMEFVSYAKNKSEKQKESDLKMLQSLLKTAGGGAPATPVAAPAHTPAATHPPTPPAGSHA